MTKGHPQQLQQPFALLICTGRRYYHHLETANAVDLVVVDLGEEKLLTQAQTVVAAAVEALAGDAAEVADAGQRRVDQPVVELPHAVAADGDHETDRVALPHLEVGDGALRAVDDRLLAGNGGDVGGGGIERLRGLERLAEADVESDLIQPRRLHGIAVAELFHEGR